MVETHRPMHITDGIRARLQKRKVELPLFARAGFVSSKDDRKKSTSEVMHPCEKSTYLLIRLNGSCGFTTDEKTEVPQSV